MTESKIEYQDAIWSDFYFIVISVYFSISNLAERISDLHIQFSLQLLLCNEV